MERLVDPMGKTAGKVNGGANEITRNTCGRNDFELWAKRLWPGLYSVL